MPASAPVVAVQDVAFQPTTGSIIANGNIIGPVDVTECEGALVSTHGTYAGVSFVTEVSDDGGTTWYPASNTSLTGSISSTVSPGTNGVIALQVNTQGANSLRVRATAWTSGTAIVNVTPLGQLSLPSVAISGTVIPGASSGAGSSTYAHATAAASTNSTLVKASAGTILAFQATNAAASVRFVKFYNKATAPTVGTDIPIWICAVPAGQTVTVTFPVALRFVTGIGFGITNLSPETDTTATTAGDVILDVNYI